MSQETHTCAYIELIYTHTGVPVGTTKFILIRSLYGVLQKLIRYRSTRRYFRTYIYTEILCILYLYYRAYPCLTDLILILQNLILYFGSHTCITELKHVFQILYLYYGTYKCISDLIHVLQSIYLSYGSYTGVTN